MTTPALKQARPVGRRRLGKSMLTTISFRIDEDTKARVDSEVEMENLAQPGLGMVRSDLVRVLMTEGLQHRLLNRARIRRPAR